MVVAYFCITGNETISPFPEENRERGLHGRVNNQANN